MRDQQNENFFSKDYFYCGWARGGGRSREKFLNINFFLIIHKRYIESHKMIVFCLEDTYLYFEQNISVYNSRLVDCDEQIFKKYVHQFFFLKANNIYSRFFMDTFPNMGPII